MPVALIVAPGWPIRLIDLSMSATVVTFGCVLLGVEIVVEPL